VQLAQHPNSTLREISAAVGVTERATLSIVRALEQEGIISRRKDGRRMHYRVDFQAVLDHPTQTSLTVRELVTQIAELVRQFPPPEPDGHTAGAPPGPP
jgi:DNA-binding Lrp family transcriptional regulator